MQVQREQIIQILEAHIENITDHLDRVFEVVEADDFGIIADKILALGKPEPLAKNKQAEEFIEKVMNNLTDIDPEFVDIVNREFWQLLDK